MRQKQAGNEGILLLGILIIFAASWSHRKLLRNIFDLVWVTCSFAILLLAAYFIANWLRQKRNILRPKRWDNMNGLEFEDQIVIWLNKCGYSHIEKTEYFDQGVDILAAKQGYVFGVQVKRASKPVGVAAVRAAVAGLKIYGCNQAMVVTNTKFTPSAVRLANVNDCILIDGDRLRRGI